jgi:hypothetical protein
MLLLSKTDVFDLVATVLDQVIQRTAAAANECADPGTLATLCDCANACSYRSWSGDSKDHVSG